MQEEYEGGWFAVLTADILYNKELTFSQKVLYAVVGNLSNLKGYCFASNKHISEIMNYSIRQMQRDLEVLESMKFITRVVKVDDKGMVTLRALTPMTSVSPPHVMDDMTPMSWMSHIKEKIKRKEDIGDSVYNGYISFVNKTLGKNYRGDSKSKRQLAARLKDGYTNLDIKKAIVNASKESFHIESKFKHLTPEFFTRADKLDKFINAGDGVPVIEKKEITPIDVNEHFDTKISDDNYGDYKP